VEEFETIAKNLPLERLRKLLEGTATITPRTLHEAQAREEQARAGGSLAVGTLDRTVTYQSPPSLLTTSPQLAASHPSLPTLRLLAGGEAATQAQALASLADLEVMGELGEGGMGRVLRARQSALGREVALKLLKPELAQLAKPVETLLQEARLTGLLEHPNIIPVHLLGYTADEGPVLVMKRVEGVNWRTLLRDPDHEFWGSERIRAPDRLAWSLEVFLRVCDAVAFAHSQHIIHRDIKPENVMVGRFGEVYLLDWGIAVRLDGDKGAQDSDRFGEAPIVGTPAYMAPEMVVGKLDSITPRTDIFLLGATLYEVLTGHVPYRANDPYQLLFMAYHGQWSPLPDSLDAELAQIVSRAMAASQDDRWPDVESLQAALRDYLTHRGSIKTTSRAEAIMERAQAAAPGSEARIDLWMEAQLALKIALDQWPDNRRAIDGLQRCAESLIEDALGRREITAAQRLLATLPSPNPALAARVQALHDELEAARLRAEQLASDADLSAGAGSRSRFFKALIAMPLVLFFSGVVFLQESSETSTRLAVQFVIGADLLGAAAVGVFWSRLKATRVNRQLVWVLSWSLALMTINRITAHLSHTPLHDMFRGDLLVLTAVVGTGMWVLHRAVVFPTLIGLIGAAATVAFPQHGFPIFVATTLLLTASMALVVSIVGRAQEPPAP
jgi:serine/threonine protein kinase